MSLEWPAAPLAGSDHSCLPSSHEDHNDENLEDALPTPPHLRWRRDTLQHRKQRGSLFRVTWNTRFLIGPPVSLQLSRERKHSSLRRLIENNNICLEEVQRKVDFSPGHSGCGPAIPALCTLKPGNASAGRIGLDIQTPLT